MSRAGLWSWPSRPCEWPAKRLRGSPVSRTVTLRRARPSRRAAARPAKLPPMMMTSSMVIGSELVDEAPGLPSRSSDGDCRGSFSLSSAPFHDLKIQHKDRVDDWDDEQCHQGCE